MCVCRLYLHRIIFIVTDAFTSYKVVHFYSCDDVRRLVSFLDHVGSSRLDDMKSTRLNWAVFWLICVVGGDPVSRVVFLHGWRSNRFFIYWRSDNLCMILLSHTFSAFSLWSSVVSVLISVTTDMSPTGDLIVTSIFVGEMFSWACSGTLMCCASLALFWLQLTLRGNKQCIKNKHV